MMRTGLVLWLMLIAAATAVLFRISQDVESLEGAVRAVNADIAAEEEAIRVLEADWSYLNQPERLRRLADAVTELAPIGSDQIVPSAAVVPLPLPEGERPLRFVGLPVGMAPPPLPLRHPSAAPLLVAAPQELAADGVDPVAGLIDAAPLADGLTLTEAAPPETMLTETMPVAVVPARRPDTPTVTAVHTTVDTSPVIGGPDALGPPSVPLPPVLPVTGVGPSDDGQPLMLRVNQ